MAGKSLYDKYHRGRVNQKRLINEKNFTYRNIIGALRSTSYGNRVLDIGSGVGTIDFYLASKGKDVTAIELAKEAADISEKSAEFLGLKDNTKFIHGDFLKLKSEGEFDLVICSEVLEHLENDSKAIAKIYQLLKKDGLALITTPSQNAPLHRLGLAKEFDTRVGHLRRYNMEDLVSLLKKNKFRILRKQNTEGLLRNFLFVFQIGNFPNRLANKFTLISDIFTIIDNIVLNLFGESNLMIICKK